MSFFSSLKNLIFPSNLTCDICGSEIEEVKHKAICEKCEKKLPFIFHGCIKCGEKIDGEYNVCYNCKHTLREFDKTYSVFEYSSVAKEMVWKLKYENARYLAKTMASFLTDHIIKNDIKFDVITFVPAYKATQKKRGYNQAKLLAEECCKNLKLNLAQDVLVRVKENTSQVDLSAKERERNIENSFVTNNKSIVKNKVVLVIDDVLTTGATMNEVAKVLKDAGASKVIGLTFANTTRKPKFEKDNNQFRQKAKIKNFENCWNFFIYVL